MNTHSTGPVITSVRDHSDTLIPHNGSAVTPLLTFEGTAAARSTVSLFDADTSLATPTTVTADGHWTLRLSRVSQGHHTFTVKSSDATAASAPWPLTVDDPQGAAGAEEWGSFPFGPLPLDQEIECAYGLKLTVTGEGASIAPNVVPGSLDHALKPTQNCKLRFDFHDRINRLYILHSGARSLHNLLRFYDAQDNVVKSTALESPDDVTRVELIEIDPYCLYFVASFVNNESETLIDALVWTDS